MTYLLVLLSLFSVSLSFASTWPLVEREAESVLASPKKLLRIENRLDKTDLLQSLKNQNIISELHQGELTAINLLEEIVKIKNLRCPEINSCASTLHEATLYLRSKNLIDDTAGLILKAYIYQKDKQINWLRNRKLDLPNLLSTLKGIQRTRNTNEADLLATILTHRSERYKVKPWGKITSRQELFLRYDLFQMKVLTNIMEKTQKRISAQSISIIVDYDGNGETDETFDVPPAERYRFAHKVLKLELANETMSQGYLSNKTITGPQMIMAASELGLVNEAVLAELIKMPELKSPRAEKGKVYLNALWSIGKTGLMAIPGGIYFVLPIIVVESYFQGKKQREARNAPTLF